MAVGGIRGGRECEDLDCVGIRRHAVLMVSVGALVLMVTFQARLHPHPLKYLYHHFQHGGCLSQVRQAEVKLVSCFAKYEVTT